MYFDYREKMFVNYNEAMDFYTRYPEKLIETEKLIFQDIVDLIEEHMDEFISDYNEANYLHPFWGEYPPENRGNQPVGEHAIEHKIARLLRDHYNIREIGLPSGADDRFLIQSDKILEINDNLTNSAMLFLDTKSVGPRDDKDEVVVSPNQVSGNGTWSTACANVMNSKLVAKGKITSHDFYKMYPKE